MRQAHEPAALRFGAFHDLAPRDNVCAAAAADTKERHMALQALGYIGFRGTNLDDWTSYATRFLGMELVDRSSASLAFRMDDRRQRVIVEAAGCPRRSARKHARCA